jgi:hypothetical protein
MIPGNTDLILTRIRGSPLRARRKERGGRSVEAGGRPCFQWPSPPGPYLHPTSTGMFGEGGTWSIHLAPLSRACPRTAEVLCIFILRFPSVQGFASVPNGTRCDWGQTKEAVINAICRRSETKNKTPRLTKLNKTITVIQHDTAFFMRVLGWFCVGGGNISNPVLNHVP